MRDDKPAPEKRCRFFWKKKSFLSLSLAGRGPLSFGYRVYTCTSGSSKERFRHLQRVISSSSSVHHITLFGQLSHTQQITFHIKYLENIIGVHVITIFQCNKNSPFSNHQNEHVITEFHLCAKWVIQICKQLLLTTHMICATCIQIPSLIVWSFILCGCY